MVVISTLYKSFKSFAGNIFYAYFAGCGSVFKSPPSNQAKVKQRRIFITAFSSRLHVRWSGSRLLDPLLFRQYKESMHGILNMSRTTLTSPQPDIKNGTFK
mmetsp:Transcript_9342/g.12909  ORF Transcript_9342/g.12909 Transcript_9342/m.12909 type:complete len:101 (+) Transcript_9342:975-1277(+)